MTTINRRSSKRVWLAIALLALLSLMHGAATAAGVLTVEVFANSAMHVTPEPSANLPYQLKVYRIDGLRQVEQAINQQLPQTEAQAREWLAKNQQRLRRQYASQATAAANGVALMQRYKLSRVPAIVINRRVVVYGLTDVDAAIARATNRGPTTPGAAR